MVGDGLLFFAGWAPGKGDSPVPSFEQLAGGMDKNKDNAITPDEVKGTPLESFFRAQDLNGDGRVIVASLDGKVTVFAAGGAAPRILHQVDFKERIAATPALAGRNVYVRTPTALYAFGR